MKLPRVCRHSLRWLTASCTLVIATISLSQVSIAQPAAKPQITPRQDEPVTLNFVNAEIDAVART